MTVSSRLKMAVVAPIPSARVETATMAKPGDLRSPRTAYRTSCQTLSTADSQPASRTRSFTASMLPTSMRAALSGFAPEHAGSHPFLDACLEKFAQLRVQLAFDLPSSKESA